MGSILTIDTGATKTRMVMFDSSLSISNAIENKISHDIEFRTPHHPSEYMETLLDNISQNFPEFRKYSEENIAVLATTGQIDNNKITSPIIGWNHFSLQDELVHALSGTRVIVGNDAKIGAIGAFAKSQTKRGLYVAIGTGIGGGMIINDQPSLDLSDMEIGKTTFMDKHETKTWETIASGSAFYKKYGRLGQNISDHNPIWREYASSIAMGLAALLPTLQPHEIIIGGAIAEFFPKYGPHLIEIIATKSWEFTANIPITSEVDFRYTVNRGALVLALRELGKK